MKEGLGTPKAKAKKNTQNGCATKTQAKWMWCWNLVVFFCFILVATDSESTRVDCLKDPEAGTSLGVH